MSRETHTTHFSVITFSNFTNVQGMLLFYIFWADDYPSFSLGIYVTFIMELNRQKDRETLAMYNA